MEQRTSTLNPLIKKFSPSQQFIDTYTLREISQMPYIITGNFSFSIGFIGLSVLLMMQQVYTVALIGLLALFFFGLSLSFIKRGKLQTGAYLTTAGLITGCFIILFFAPYIQSGLLAYRNAFFLVVMAIFNQLISLKRRQIAVFSATTGAMWIADWFTVFKPLFADPQHDPVGALFVCTFAIIVSFVTLFLINKFNRRLTEQAEQKEQAAQQALAKIKAVVEESKNGLTVGHRLIDSTSEATDSVARIEELSRYLITESSNLSSETATVSDSGSHITDQANKMKDSVHEQTASITETSAAMTEISANSANISKIASAQRTGMDEVVKSLDSQRSLLNELVTDVTEVKESSDGIAQFVSTIDSISSQTSLLAMNASIEAAHAGNFGKGFSVIAQEIRKLSEETTKSAAHISDTLKQNGEIVKKTSDSVQSFATYTAKSAEDLRTTLEAIEQILAGISEMNTGTQDIMKALENIVDESQNNAGLVENVVSEISKQKEALHHMSQFAGTLKERASGLDGALAGIQNAIVSIQKEAFENTEVGEKISASVNS